MKHIATFALAGLVVSAGAALAQDTPAPENAEVYFANLSDGDTVEGPVTVIFGLEGMGVAPAGMEADETGHHHVLINRPLLGEGPDGSEEMNGTLPADENHRHFGGGQTQTTLDLEPGTHTLQLVFADHNHVPHDPPVASQVIEITVE